MVGIAGTEGVTRGFGKREVEVFLAQIRMKIVDKRNQSELKLNLLTSIFSVQSGLFIKFLLKFFIKFPNISL